MARVNVYLPDELAATMREQLPALNVSQLLREAIVEVLGCRHQHLACASCATAVDGRRLQLEALDELYRDAMWALRDLVERGGTAEGAARIVKDVAERHQVPMALRVPLPRPARAQRHADTVKELPEPARRSA